MAQLVAWVCNSPGGLACVVYDSEYARRAAEERLRNALTEVNIPVVAFELPAEQPAAEVARCLARRLSQIPSGVASISGFATAFTPDVPLPESLGTLNYQRETLAHFPLCQIWWLPRRFEDALSRAALDTYSWFLVRLRLAEIASGPMVEIRSATGRDDRYVSVSEARRQAAGLVLRFRAALRIGALPTDALSLAVDAISVLADAGAFKAASRLDAAMARLLVASTGGPATLGAAALRLTEDQAASGGVDVARVLNKLGAAYMGQGRHREAEPLCRRAAATFEGVLGPEHRSTAIALTNLGICVEVQGMLVEAQELLSRAVGCAQRALGPDHPDTARCLRNLAVCRAGQGKLVEAQMLFEWALRAITQALGPESPATYQAQHDLAVCLAEEGMYSEAEPLLLSALDGLLRSGGGEHPDLVMCLNSLAAVYARQGLDEVAVPLFRRALDIAGRTIGLDHPDAAIVRRNLDVVVGALAKTPQNTGSGGRDGLALPGR